MIYINICRLFMYVMAQLIQYQKQSVLDFPNIDVQMDVIKTMLREEPVVRSCVQRIAQSVACKEMQLMENGKAVAKSLMDHFSNFVGKFLRDSIEMCFACGFVAFTIRRKEPFYCQWKFDASEFRVV